MRTNLKNLDSRFEIDLANLNEKRAEKLLGPFWFSFQEFVRLAANVWQQRFADFGVCSLENKDAVFTA